MQGPRRLAAQKHLIHAKAQRADDQTLGHPRFEVARAMQFVVQPTALERHRIVIEFVARAALAHRFKHRVGRQHAGLDRGVAALDARGIEKARLVADHAAAGKDEFGQ